MTMTTKVSIHASAPGIVRHVEALLLADRSYQHSGGAATIFIVQALPYVCRTNSDPWSPNYPKPEDVVKTIESYTGIKVERI